ncbi:hypothetical protein [Paraclostridium bifermentans]|uniref:hypothetical protein n=1 Tax=Paraclostridium bifermentans TaxID=1490 RepID=UPI00241E6598|nr:hypothetical protein [Paraclostridium bifermentans]
MDKQRLENIERLGYKVYYTKVGSGIEIDVERANLVMNWEVKGIMEKLMCNEFNVMDSRDYKSILKKYDYRERAISENAKCMVIFLVVLGKSAIKWSDRNQSFKDTIYEVLKDFTEDECSFIELVEFGNEIAKNNVTPVFFDKCMDCIMNIVLKYDI